MVQSLYITAFSLYGNQYEFTHTTRNFAISSGRNDFAAAPEDTLEINYLG